MLTIKYLIERHESVKRKAGRMLAQLGQHFVQACRSLVQIVTGLSLKSVQPVQWGRLFISEIVLKPAGFIVRRCFAVDVVSKKCDFTRAPDACETFLRCATACQVLFRHCGSTGNAQGNQMTSCAGFGRLGSRTKNRTALI